MRKILFIAYHFYPDAAIGAQRSVKYAKFLPQHGWQPHVLTVDTKYYTCLDPTPLGFECPVTRTGKWIVPDDMWRKIRPIRAKAKRDGATPDKPSPPDRSVPGPVYPRWKRFINSLSTTPDIHSGWYLPAVRAAMRLIAQERFDAIYTSGPPHTCHVIGITVARRSGLPWIIDFRDPWYEPDRGRPHMLQWSKDFDRRNEARAVKMATLVVTTTPEWREHLKERYHGAIDDKCVAVLNGFDETEFPPLDSVPIARPEGPTTFFHGGTLYAGRNPIWLLRAVGELIRDGMIKRDAVRVNFFGNCDFDPAEIHAVIAEEQLGDCVTLAGGVNKGDYVRMILESDVLILFQSDLNAVHLPAKTFEYLATGNRILALTGEGSTRNFLKDFGHVSIANDSDKAAIKTALRELLSRPRGQRLSERETARIHLLTKERLAAEFAGLLNEFIPNGR